MPKMNKQARWDLRRYVLPNLPRYTSANDVLDTPPRPRPDRIQPKPDKSLPLAASIPVVDGKYVKEQLAKWAAIEEQIEALRQQVTTIRDELADHLGPPGYANGLGRAFVHGRELENLREDAAKLVLLRYLGALGVPYWGKAMALIDKGAFDLVFVSKLLQYKMRK